MIDNFISFLKDGKTISNLWIYFIVFVVFILVLKSLLKSTNIKPKVFDNIALLVCIIFLGLIVGNVIITKDYDRLWNVFFVFAISILQKLIPKFEKWYDNKVDDIIDRT